MNDYKRIYPILLLSVTIFGLIAAQLNSQVVERFDLAVITVVQDKVSPLLTKLMLLTTALGSTKEFVLITLVCSLIMFFSCSYLLGIYLSISVAFGAGGLNQLLKALFRRERPHILRLATEHGFSFPSGHAMGSVILYGGLAFVLYHLYKGKWPFVVGVIIASVLIILIGISRIYLGVHYPSDVIAGYAGGVAWLLSSVIAFRFIEGKLINRYLQK